MKQKTLSVTFRMNEAEHTRMMQALGHNYAWDQSSLIRAAIATYCEQVEEHRRKQTEQTAAAAKPKAVEKVGR